MQDARVVVPKDLARARGRRRVRARRGVEPGRLLERSDRPKSGLCAGRFLINAVEQTRAPLRCSAEAVAALCRRGHDLAPAPARLASMVVPARSNLGSPFRGTLISSTSSPDERTRQSMTTRRTPSTARIQAMTSRLVTGTPG